MDSFGFVAEALAGEDIDFDRERAINEAYTPFRNAFFARMKKAKQDFEEAYQKRTPYPFNEPVVSSIVGFMKPVFNGKEVFVIMPEGYAEKVERLQNSPDLDDRIFCQTIKEYSPIHESLEICAIEGAGVEKAHSYSCLLSHKYLNPNNTRIQKPEFRSNHFDIPYPGSVINQAIQKVIRENNVSVTLAIAYVAYELDEEKIPDPGVGFKEIVSSLKN